MCISSFLVSIFRGSPGTKNQLLQASPCPEQQPSPIPGILLQARQVWGQTQRVPPCACLWEEKDNPSLSSVPITDTKHWIQMLLREPEKPFISCSLPVLPSPLTFPFLLGRSLLKMFPQKLNKSLSVTAPLRQGWSSSRTVVPRLITH